MEIVTIIGICLIILGIVFIWMYIFKGNKLQKLEKEVKKGNENDFIIKEIKVGPNDLSEKEKQSKINTIKLENTGVQEIIKREVKEDGYLYIMLKISKIDKEKKERLYYLIAAIVCFGFAIYALTYKVSLNSHNKYDYLVGEKYTYEIAQKLGGNSETLQRTNNQTWIAYFPKANITIVEDKRTGIIEKVMKGKK